MNKNMPAYFKTFDRYLKGEMDNQGMYEFEKELLDDPILYEMFEGFKNTSLNRTADIPGEMEKDISLPRVKVQSLWFYFKAAAVIVIAGSAVAIGLIIKNRLEDKSLAASKKSKYEILTRSKQISGDENDALSLKGIKQFHQFSGKITDNNNRPVVGAKILSAKSDSLSTTDQKGQFNFYLKDTNIVIKVIGPQKSEQTIPIKYGLNITIRL